MYMRSRIFTSSERKGETEEEEEGILGREFCVEGYGDVVWCDVFGLEWSGLGWAGLLAKEKRVEGNVLPAGVLLGE